MSRKFSEDATLSNVYDWVGSLSCTPKNFTLSKNPKEVLSLDESVRAASASVLSMTEIEVLSVQGESGDETHEHNDCSTKAGNHDGASNLSEQLYELPVIDATLPDIIMEEDKPSPDDPRSVEEESQAHFKTLEERRQREAEKLKRDEHLVVNKQDTMKELLKRYKEDSGRLTESKLMVSFEDEDVSGDGLLRELYSFFLESFIAQNCKGSSQIYLLCRAKLVSGGLLGSWSTNYTPVYSVRIFPGEIGQGVRSPGTVWMCRRGLTSGVVSSPLIANGKYGRYLSIWCYL